MSRIPLDEHQTVTIDATGRRAVVTVVHRRPGDPSPYAYTVQADGYHDDRGQWQVQPDEVLPTLLDLDEIDAAMAEANASGAVDGPAYNWAALSYARAAEKLRAEVGFLRRSLELDGGKT